MHAKKDRGLERDSKKQLSKWKNELSADEIDQIERECHELSKYWGYNL